MIRATDSRSGIPRGPRWFGHADPENIRGTAYHGSRRLAEYVHRYRGQELAAIRGSIPYSGTNYPSDNIDCFGLRAGFSCDLNRYQLAD